MKNYLNSIRNILHNHAVNALFNTRLIHCEPGNIVLNLKCRDDLIRGINPGGTFGCIVDCVARLASYEHIGDSFMSEYELNIHTQIPSREFVAYAVVDSSNSNSVVYSCGIYAVANPENKLVAESQGTLLKNTHATISDKRDNNENQDHNNIYILPTAGATISKLGAEPHY